MAHAPAALAVTPLLLGHRGARAVAPENTMAGLRRGLADGADGLEFDVRMLGDGTPVLLHDATVDRTTDGHGLLSSFDRRSIARLDAGSTFGTVFASERIPLLAEVLDALAGRTLLAIEMKEVLPDAVLDELARTASRRGAGTLLVASFLPEALERARARATVLRRALILPAGAPIPEAALVDELALWGLFAPQQDVEAGYAREVAGRLAHWVYTVNEPERAAELAALGVDALITDDPARVRGGLRGR